MGDGGDGDGEDFTTEAEDLADLESQDTLTNADVTNASPDTLAAQLDMTNQDMNTAIFGDFMGGFLNSMSTQAQDAIDAGLDLGDPGAIGGEGGDDDPYRTPPKVAPPAVTPETILTKTPLDAAEEERRKIARRTGRKSTILTKNPLSTLNVAKKTLLGS